MLIPSVILQFPPYNTSQLTLPLLLLSPLLLHSSPAFLVFFFFITFSIVTRQRRLAGDTATPTWPHSRAHNEVAATPPPNLSLLLLSLEEGRRHRKCQVNNPKHTPYGTSSRGTSMLQIPPLHPALSVSLSPSLLKNNAHG